MSDFGVLALAIAIFYAVDDYTDMNIATEAAKAGLQQCVVEHTVVWQKECK